MKKIITLAVLFALGSANTFSMLSYGAEIDEFHSESNETPINARSVTVRYWFKSIPPKNYKNRVRVDYYKVEDGYIGVYF